MLMAHLDVVPVDPSAPWQHPAFGAEIVDGEIWGRGTLDDKGCVVGICEAVERLLEQDVTPAQDVWLSFGCDEEVSGGAAQAAVEELRRRDVRPWFVLDEGGAVAHGAFPGVEPPVAVIGVTEKGVTSLRLTRGGPGRPRLDPGAQRADGPDRPRGRPCSRAPFSASLPAPTRTLMTRLAPHAPLALRPLMGNAERLAPAAHPRADRRRAPSRPR